MSTVSPDPHGPREQDLRPDPSLMGTRRGASESDPVTGPLPVVSLADGHLEITVRRGVTIVGLDGALDDSLAETVVGPVARAIEGATAVLLDVDRVTLLDQTAIETVLSALARVLGDVPCCIVAGRLSCRLVLERWHVPDRYAVFSSVPDALQALEFVESGYGDGWAAAG